MKPCWARRQWARYPDAAVIVHRELPEYDLGAVFFTATGAVHSLFDTACRLADRCRPCEQWGLSQAVYGTNIDLWNRHSVGLGSIANRTIEPVEWHPSAFHRTYPRISLGAGGQ